MDGHTLKQNFSVEKDKAEQMRWCLTRNILPSILSVWMELDVEIVSVLSQFCARVTSATFIEATQNFNTAHFPRLMSLAFYECSLESFGNLRNCPNLTTLLLDDCPRLSTESLLSSLTGCPKLTEISITRCNMVEQSAISYIYNHNVRLVSFAFGGTPERPFYLSNIMEGCAPASSTRMRSVITSCCIVCSLGMRRLARISPLLQKLQLSNFASDVSDADIKLLCCHCPLLTELGLDHLPHLTSAALVSIGQNSSFLRCLSVAYNYGITDEGVIAIAKGCSQLVSLNISHCANITDMAVRELWSNCALLRSLDLRGCVLVTDEAFLHRVSNTLHALYVSNTSVNGAFVKQMPRIVRLYCNDCPNISSNFVRDIVSSNIIKGLHLVATKLSVDDLLLLSSCLPYVQSLNLGSSLANDDVVRSFASNCHYLEFFYVRQCAAVTKDAKNALKWSFKTRLNIIG